MASPRNEVGIHLPHLHAKQQLAFDTEATEVLYGGATRGGKSYFTKWALINWCTEIPGLQCVIYRLNFDDVITNYMKGKDGFPTLLAAWEAVGLVTITRTEVRFWNGSLIELRHCSDERAQNKGQGNPIHVCVFEEAAQILESNMRFIRGWVTMDEEMLARVPDKWKGRFPKIIYTSNPFGQSAGYLRRGFVKAAKPMEVFRAPPDDGGFNRIYIPARVEDNPSEDSEAVIRRISGIGDEALADALLNENWDAPVGDFVRQWKDSLNVVDDFMPPDHWFKWRGYDWGSADPAFCVWLTISDGEPFTDHTGTVRQFPRGSRIAYREWNICNPTDPKKGLELSNVEQARGILERTIEPHSGLTITDSFPFANRGGKLISQEFMEMGVPLTLGNTSRAQGWKFMKDLIQGITHKDANGIIQRTPMFYACRSCKHLIGYIPVLQRHKTKMEDAVEDGEATHSCFIGSTQVMTPTGPRPIAEIQPGDVILAGDGVFRPCSAAGKTRANKVVNTLELSNGETVTCTPDHRIYTEKGLVEAYQSAGHRCIIYSSCNQSELATLFRSSIRESSTNTPVSDILPPTDTNKINGDSIGLFGSTTTAESPRGTTSTTKTTIQPIITSTIWSLLRDVSIWLCTWRSLGEKPRQRKQSRKLLQQLQHGTDLKRARLGTRTTMRNMATSCMSAWSEFVQIVTSRFGGYLTPATDSVPRNASRGFIGKPKKDLRPAPIVQGSLRSDTYQRPNIASRVVLIDSVREEKQRQDVYCLTEPVTGAFVLACGLKVKNCDATRVGLFTNPPIVDHPAEITGPKWAEPSSISVARVQKLVKEHGRSASR